MMNWHSTSGWRKKKRKMQADNKGRLTICALLLVLAAPMACAQQQNMPSPELLEFLGRFGNKKGEWLDPRELDKMQFPRQQGNTTHEK